MTQRLKLLVLLICLSLISILAVQGYFLYTDYQTKKIDFRNDLNAVLELTTREMNKLREREIYQMSLEDMKDTTYIKLEYDLEAEEGPKIKVYDARTRNLELSITTSWDKISRDSLSEDYLFNKFFRLPRGDNDNFLWGVSFSLSDRLAAYRDSLAIDLDLFESKLREQMESLFITPNYETLFVHEDSAYTFSDQQTIASDRFEFNHRSSKREVIVYFEKPFFNVIKRSYGLLFASLCAVGLIIYSFILLIKTIDKQRKLSQVKDDFIDNVTHELLTPIATMKIALETLEAPDVLEDEEKTRKYLRVSSQELARVSGIVHNVLNTSLYEQNEVRLNYEQVDLNKVITDLIYYHSNRSAKTVQFVFETKETLVLNTDKQHITNVIHNLIDNAIKYNTTDTAIVHLELERKETEILITVRDNGAGVTAGHEDRIFEKFYRAVNQKTETVSGLGVGLYYVRNILERLNGSIRLAKTSAQGTAFEVSLKTNDI